MECELILRSQTMNLFSDEWYKKTSSLIENKVISKGFVYFVKNGKDSKSIKIGATTNIESRMKSFKTTFDKGVFLIGFIETNTPFQLEKEIHNDFAEKRKKGEFFNLSHVDIFNIRDVYDLKLKSSYINNQKIKSIPDNDNIIDFDLNLVELIKSLELNKKYTVSNISSLYLRKFGEKYSKSNSWLGRDVSSICGFLGLKKINKNENAIRYFELR